MRDVARPLRRGPPRPRPGRRGRDGAARLGRLRHLLPLSAGALAAPADEQPAGVGLQRGAVADECGQADAPPRRRALPGLQAGRAAEPELAGAEWGCELDDVGVGGLRVQRRPAAGAAQPGTDRHSRMINGRRGREFPQLLRLPRALPAFAPHIDLQRLGTIVSLRDAYGFLRVEGHPFEVYLDRYHVTPQLDARLVEG